MTLHVLHLEDNADDAALIQKALAKEGLAPQVRVAASRADYLSCLDSCNFDLILSDSRIPGIDAFSAIAEARRKCGPIPFIVVSGHDETDALSEKYRAAGAADYVSKQRLPQLIQSIRSAICNGKTSGSEAAFSYEHAMEKLVAAIQSLSLARDLETVMGIVRHAARDLTGADGATFVLRDGDMCHYADEDAISPLWKGRRFPMNACISGWAMLNRQHAVIEDIYADSRIPADAYRPTFVKSLAMVPIRTTAPIGAIGTYWATRHLASTEEVKVLRALADSTSVAIENVRLYAELEERVRERTAQLETANKELEEFSHSVSHDLRAPLRSIAGFSQILLDEQLSLSKGGQDALQRVRGAATRMAQIIEDLLALSRVGRTPLHRQDVNLSQIVTETAAMLAASAPDRNAEWTIAPHIIASGDPGLLRIAMENLLSNAWKFTSKCAYTRIEFGTTSGDKFEYYIRDNGAGFDSEHAENLFGTFQRLHADSEFPGTGIGLATVARILHRHGGKIRAEAAIGRGAAFYFTLPPPEA